MPAPDVIDEICDYALQVGRDISWLNEPLTRGRGHAYLLQHIPRNRLLSSVMRPSWISRCPDLAIVRKTIGQMNEELVHDAAISRAHTEILWEAGRNAGLTDAQMSSVTLMPKVEIAFNVWENIARTRHWISGWLATSVDEFIISTMRDHNFRAEAWMKTFALSREQVFFFTYHTKADEDHAGRKAWAPINNLLTNDRERADILQGMKLALNALVLFYEGVCELGDRMEQGLKKA